MDNKAAKEQQDFDSAREKHEKTLLVSKVYRNSAI